MSAPAVDLFAGMINTLYGPAVGGYSVTPSDSADIPYVTRGIGCLVSGNVQVTPIGTNSNQGDTPLNGGTIVISVVAGAPYPIRVSRIWNTNTTATGIVALV